LTLNGRTIELVILYSPSARAANRISFERLMELYKQELLKNVEGVE
jgi:G:T/U-mismatch repair DNA glycosylase